MAALSKEGKTQVAVDNLVITVLAIDDTFAPASSQELAEAVKVYFGLTLVNDALQSSLDRLVSSARIIRHNSSHAYFLPPYERVVAESRLNDTNSLESTVREEWLADIDENFKFSQSGWENKLWACLKAYMAKAFKRHGAQTIQLLNPTIPMNEENRLSLSQYLKDATSEHCKDIPIDISFFVVQKFFQENITTRTRYITQLLDGTFTFYALSMDNATSNFLKGNFAPLSLFLDTNFIFGILKLHDNPLNDISRELVSVIKNLHFPFKLYYHEETLEELQKYIWSTGNNLKNRPWTSQLSRAAVNNGKISGLEMRYHEKNSMSPIDPNIFLSKYEHIPTLLSEENFTIYRNSSKSKVLDEERHLLVAQYIDALEKRSRTKPYEAVNQVVSSGFRHLGYTEGRRR